MRLRLPTTVSEETILPLLNQLPRLVAEPALTLDFSTVAFARPFGAILLAEAIRYLSGARGRYGRTLTYATEGIQTGVRPAAVSYLGHIGFFRRAGIPFGNQPAEALGSSTYMPITPLTRARLDTSGQYGALQEAIKRESYRLAGLITTDDTCTDLLAYCFREIVRNVFEHADTSECVVVGQKWGNRQVELAIVDRGRGILASLAEVFTDLSASEALRLAISPGVTRHRDHPDRGKWDNSGFGLFVTSDLCRQYGRFTLVSSGTALSIAQYYEEVKPAFFPGTAVRLVIDIEDAEYFANILTGIVARGEATAPGGPTQASTASKGSGKSE